MPFKNPTKRAKYDKKYRDNNKEKIRKQAKQYRENCKFIKDLNLNIEKNCVDFMTQKWR